MVYHCLFEQSGTFKNQFKKMGFTAYDYDILNDFNETDYLIDLYHEIEESFRGGASIFDKFMKEDVILAFFPCTRFENQIYMAFQGTQWQLKKKSDLEKLEYNIKLHEELSHNYQLITKMAIICLKKGLRMIIENPYSKEHYLTRYWSLRPKLIDTDRTEMGDYYVKPTQYWFINIEPTNNLVFEAIPMNKKRPIHHTPDKVERSMISPDYANRFIREFILTKEQFEKVQENL